MGRQDGLIQLTGGVGNLSFYKSQDGYLVRKKSGVSRERIMSDRAYARTRENIAEFGRGALATKLLRRAFRSVIVTAADNRVTSRLTSAIMKVIKSDAINSRGQRNFADGDVTLFEGFEFNKNAGLEKTFGAPFTAIIDRATGSMRVTIPAFCPVDVISAPEGATHFRLMAVGAALDFEANTYSIAESESAYLPIRQKMQEPLLLSHAVAPASVNPLLLVLGIEFVQLINGVHYPLKDDMFNAMAIVRVDGAELNTRAKPAHLFDERSLQRKSDKRKALGPIRRRIPLVKELGIHETSLTPQTFCRIHQRSFCTLKADGCQGDDDHPHPGQDECPRWNALPLGECLQPFFHRQPRQRDGNQDGDENRFDEVKRKCGHEVRQGSTRIFRMLISLLRCSVA